MPGPKVIPPSNLPPQSQPWARGIEDNARREVEDIESLRVNTLADFQQLNATTSATYRQLAGVQNYLYSIPNTIPETFSITGISLPANTWTYVFQEQVQAQPLKNKVTLLISASISIPTGTTSLGVWFSLYAGSGTSLSGPLPGIATGSSPTTYEKVAQASTSSTYVFSNPKSPGSMTPQLGLWCSTALNSPSARIIVTTEMIYGGE